MCWVMQGPGFGSSIDIAVSMNLKFIFSYRQPGYKGKYCYSPAQFSVAIGYGASV